MGDVGKTQALIRLPQQAQGRPGPPKREYELLTPEAPISFL